MSLLLDRALGAERLAECQRADLAEADHFINHARQLARHVRPHWMFAPLTPQQRQAHEAQLAAMQRRAAEVELNALHRALARLEVAP